MVCYLQNTSENLSKSSSFFWSAIHYLNNHLYVLFQKKSNTLYIPKLNHKSVNKFFLSLSCFALHFRKKLFEYQIEIMVTNQYLK
jgi:hypothetical protein